jgi:hypothetical protein
MFKYEWRNSYDEVTKVISKLFIKKIFDVLNKSTLYVDVDGKFVGYIIAVDGPLGTIHIISDHSLTDKSLFCFIKVVYLDRTVLHLTIDGAFLVVNTFLNGYWANSIMNIK